MSRKEAAILSMMLRSSTLGSVLPAMPAVPPNPAIYIYIYIYIYMCVCVCIYIYILCIWYVCT